MLNTFDHIFDAAIGLDIKGQITYFNHQAISFFKLSPRLLKQKKYLEEIFRADDFDISEWVDKSLLSFEVNLSPEIQITLFHEPVTYFVILKVFPVETPEGNRFIIIFQDKTIEHNLHNKYRDQVEELRKTHEQIIQADKLSTLGELTANISHEINNPLTIASGHCELLNEGLSSSDPMAKIDFLKLTATTIQDSLDRVNQIIRNMKSFLHKKEDKKEYCNLLTIIENAHRWVKGQEKEEITLHIDNCENAIVLANGLKLEQVFLNFIKNSYDALIESQTKNPTIKISFELKDHQVLIHIQDNGPGIPEHLKGDLFKPFSTTKETGKGTGLGLSISAKIIESHQGSIQYIDSPQGAHFLISLPSIEKYSYSRTDFFQIDDLKKRILILDNEALILNLMSGFLEETGHYIIGSSSPEEALDLLEKANIDIILTDYTMPSMNGSQFAKQARLKGFLGPIYYMTGSQNIEKYNADKNKYKISGVILKPFHKEEIVRIINSAVKGLATNEQ
ncbi:MAG TPA: ATP-binding protein [Bacteriovoracaceae bacterium]|nr:ATP-binding protein [Bacteriovoracaceae bacterium]